MGVLDIVAEIPGSAVTGGVVNIFSTDNIKIAIIDSAPQSETAACEAVGVGGEGTNGAVGVYGSVLDIGTIKPARPAITWTGV